MEKNKILQADLEGMANSGNYPISAQKGGMSVPC